MVELVETLQIKALLVSNRIHDSGLLGQLYKDRRGVTLVEYGLIAALICVAAIVAMQTLGTNINDQFSSAANKIANPNP